MDWYVPFLVFAATGLTIQAAHWWYDPRNRARRRLKRRRNVPIGDVKQGEWVKVTGVVTTTEQMLKSPISDEACIGFRLVVKVVDDGSDVVLKKESCTPFAIRDETGNAIVEGPFLVGINLEGRWSALTPRWRIGEAASC